MDQPARGATDPRPPRDRARRETTIAARGNNLLLPFAPLAIAGLFAGAVPVLGQASQYTAPGALGTATVAPREALQSAVADARWHLGPLRLDPWFGLREVAWVDPGQGPGDLTASAGLGLRAYLPAGAHAIVAAHILPEYVWWRNHADARHVGGREGVGLFVYGNRAELSLTATTSRLSGLATSEVDQRADQKDRRYEGNALVPFSSELALLLRGGVSDYSARDTGVGIPTDFAVLDRRDSWEDAGLQWAPTGHLALSAGVGRTQSDFAAGARDRSNDGSSWFGELAWRRVHTDAAVAYRENRLDPKGGSEFPAFRGATGNARIGWHPRPRFSLALYALRDLTYSVEAASPYFIDRRVGAQLGLALGSRANLTLFHESGTDDYVGATPDADVTSDGAGLQVTLLAKLRLVVDGRRTHTRSPLDDRTYSQVGFQIVYHGGLGGSAWY